MARSRKDTMKLIKHELDRTKNYRLEQGYDDLWERMVDLYRGRTLPSVNTVEDRIVVNVAFGTINVIYPSVSVNYPKITVMPNTPMDEDTAYVVEGITNYNWKHFNYQDQFRLAVKDYLLIGHGWIKTGYRYKEQEVTLEGHERDQMFSDQIMEADEFAATNPEMAGDVPTDEEIVGALPETRTVIAEDQPFVERVSPFDMFVDVEATTMHDARWVCQRIVRHLTDVKNDDRYKKSVRMNVKADLEADQFRDQQRSFFRRGNQDPEDQRVTIYEFYNIKNNTVAILAEGSDEFLIDPKPCPFTFGHPFVMLRNYDIPDFFYPMGDLEAIEPLVQELNKTRSIAIQVRKKFARKFLYREGAFNPEGRQALMSDVDNTFVPVADENTPFPELIGVVPQVPVPPEIFEHSDVIEKDIGDVTGVSEYQRGQVPETRRTATEAAIISDNVNARSADKLAQVEQCIARVARRIVQLQQQFMSQVQVARVLGQDRAIYWVPYNAEDIQGEFDFEVEAGSTQPMNETVRRQTATALMEAMGPFIGTIIDPAALAQHVLKFGFGVPNPGKFMMMPPPMQPGMPGDPSMGGVGGPQGAPMGGGFMNENGEVGNQLPGGGMEMPSG